MKFSTLTILMMLLLSATVSAQDLDEVSETVVVYYLRDANPGAEDVTWMKVDDTDRIRITFVEADVKQYAIVNQEGVEYETGSLIGEDNLPEPTIDAFMDSKYSEWDVLGIWKASTPRTSGLYRFDVSNDDDETVTLYYNDLGESVTINHNVNPGK